MPHIKGTKWKFEDIFSKIYIENFDVDHQKISENTLEWICPLTVKEFVLIYQHKAILSDAILVEKAKKIAMGLGVPEGTLAFSTGWLGKFKNRNGIHQIKLHGEASSADLAAISDALPLLKSKCEHYPPERIYNMDETGLFYR